MVDEFLNQDEIDALLSGGDGGGGNGNGGSTGLSQGDSEILKEVSGIVATAAGNVIGMLAGRDVSAEGSEQFEIPQGEMASKIDGGKVFSYSMVLNGLDAAPARLLTSERGALALADLMMGGDAKELPSEANDLYLSAAQEGLSQLVGSALTSLSGLLGGVRLSADSSASSLDEPSEWLPFSDQGSDAPIWVGKVDLNVEGVEPFSLDIALPIANAADLAAKIKQATASSEAPSPAPKAAPAGASRPQAQGAPAAAPAAAQPSLPPRPQGPPVDVKPVEFAQLGGSDFAGSLGNLDLIVDIPVRITVELGRTRKTIGEVLALGPGSVVELNKMAGEPVDVLVNGKLIARGEVVVIDESFGIRVTEVVSKAERIRSMGV
ncbi:MAG: flagellar motor switch protein FliN [Synergistaceae bacterium]|jgi:flagellar motor switch protein FliN/FliY|nr:flagellar motor switch protein FliN [Synergistaceae bacterium]